MPTTIIYGDQTSEVSSATSEDDELWLALEELRRSTGWELKPEGVCLGDICVTIPVARRQEFLREEDGFFNLAAFGRFRHQPVLHDYAHDIWLFGEAASSRREVLRSLQAPNFTLPDLDGHLHSLLNSLGKKIFLVSWASW